MEITSWYSYEGLGKVLLYKSGHEVDLSCGVKMTSSVEGHILCGGSLRWGRACSQVLILRNNRDPRGPLVNVKLGYRGPNFNNGHHMCSTTVEK